MNAPLRILFALPGLHRVIRGAETAFEEVARHLALIPGNRVTLIGSGEAKPAAGYEFRHASCIPRERFERWPKILPLRTHYAYEELTFMPALAGAYSGDEFDVTVTCGYPFANWLMRMKRNRDRRPRHVFVTQNGDWMCHAGNREYRFFGCDGLICTNPEYYERNRGRWRSVLIPNGVDPTIFHPGAGQRRRFGLPDDRLVVLMVSALIPSKRVLEGIEAVAGVDGAHLVIAGDGELRDAARDAAARLLNGRFTNLQLPRQQMPDLYRSADVFLHMSQDEPSANAYIEALATGLPIVTEDREVTRWTLEDTAVLLDTSNLPAVSEAIRKAATLRSEADIARRRALVSRRFAWAGIAAQYGEFFREVCA